MFKPAKIKFSITFAFFFALLCAPSALAQCNFTVVTGTITDPNGLPYSNGSISAILVNPSPPQQPLCGGVAISGFTQASLDVNGSFTMNLAANAGIVPSGTTWVFTVNGNSNLPRPVGLGGVSFTSGGITIFGATQSLSTTLSTLASALTVNFGGGGAGNPAAPGCALQLANSTVTGFATSVLGGVPLGPNSCSSPNELTVPYSESVAGPNPAVDASFYGVVGDGVTDSTAALRAAITAACSNKGEILLPAGSVVVTQAQGGPSSTAAVYTSCAGLTINGGGNATTLQFMSSPTTKIIVQGGANPSAGALFNFPIGGAGNSVTLKNLILACQNQCVDNAGGSNDLLLNVGMSVTTMGSSYADNVALVQDGFWFTWRDGTIQGGILMPIYNNGTGAYHQMIENVVFNGGNPGSIGSGAITGAPVIVDLRQNTTTYAGVWKFFNDSVEDANTDFLQVENSTSNPCGTALPAGIEDITLDHITYADGAGQTAMYTQGFGMSGCGSNGVVVLNSNGDNGNGGDAIRATNGSLQGFTVYGPYGFANSVVDGNGNPIGSGKTQGSAGDDVYVTPPSLGLNHQLRTDISVANQTLQTRPEVSGIALTLIGNLFRSVQLDPQFGLMLSTGANYGYNSSIGQTAEGDTDFYFASLMPPTAASGTATTGGSLAAGSYWFTIRAALTTNCSSITQSAPTLVGPVVVSGSNNAVQLNWTQPIGTSAVGNYCVQAFTSAPGNSLLASTPTGLISSASTSPSMLVTTTSGGTSTSTAVMSSSLVATHRFFPNGLSINKLTLTAGYNFDLLGNANISGNLNVGSCTGCGATVVTRAVTASSDTILGTDCVGNTVAFEGSVAVAEDLPTPGTLGVAQCTFTLYSQLPGQIVTVTPASMTINNRTPTGTVFYVYPGDSCSFKVDASTTNWIASCYASGSDQMISAATPACYGATPQAIIANCTAAAIALGRNAVDLRPLSGTQNFTGTVTLCDGTHALTYIGPDTATWNFTLTSGVSATGTAVFMRAKCRFVSNAPPLRFQIANTSVTNGAYTMFSTVDPDRYYLDGVTWENESVPVASGFMFLIPTAADQSYFGGAVEPYASGGVLIGNTTGSPCCKLTLNMEINGNGTSTGPLLKISGTSGGDPNGIQVEGSIDHEGSGSPAILCQDTSSAHLTTVWLGPGYTETGSSDTSTIPIQEDGCNVFSVNNWELKQETSGANQPLISLTNNANTLATFTGINCTVGCGGVTTAIQDNIAADCASPPCNVPINSNGTVPNYTNLTQYFSNLDLFKPLGAAFGGTGLNTSSSTGAPVISSGTWSVIQGLTGQVETFNNGAAPTANSPGLVDGNGGSPVTSANYTIKCDSSTTLLDRITTLRFQSGASTPAVPLSTASGCAGLSAVVIDDGAGSLVFGRTSPDTFTVCNGATCTDGATSFTLSNGQYAALNQGASGIWEVRIVTSGSGLADPGGNGVVYRSALNTTATATAHNIGTPLDCADSSGSGTAQNCTTAPTFTPASPDCIVYTTTTQNSGTGLTINVNSAGAASVAIPGSAGWTTTLTAHIIPANKPIPMCYDGTNWDAIQTGTVASSGSGGFAGTVVYTSAQTASSADNGKLVIMNCTAACAYTLPATQPSTTFQIYLATEGTTAATIALGGGDTWFGTATAPTAPPQYQAMLIAANSSVTTDYVGSTGLTSSGGTSFSATKTTLQVASTPTGTYGRSASTNFGSTLTTQAITSNFFHAIQVHITVYQTLAGVGCGAGSNTVGVTVNFTDPNANTQSVTVPLFSSAGSAGTTFTISANGSLANASGNYAQGEVSLPLDFNGATVSYSTTSTLASTGCTTTPQYTVQAAWTAE